jgi:hypothetical protein
MPAHDVAGQVKKYQPVSDKSQCLALQSSAFADLPYTMAATPFRGAMRNRSQMQHFPPARAPFIHVIYLTAPKRCTTRLAVLHNVASQRTFQGELLAYVQCTVNTWKQMRRNNETVLPVVTLLKIRLSATRPPIFIHIFSKSCKK